MKKNFGINIAILGKTGVGKSSFCNYIFNEPLSRTGEGKPVTTWEENFQKTSTHYNNYTLNIFDTVGIEADNFDRWNMEFNKFLDSRDYSYNTKPMDWIHCIFYLINASAARVEDTELNIMEKVVQKKIPLQIILTNSDSASENELSKIKECILHRNSLQNIKITQVCSVSIKKRLGSTKQYGRDEVLKPFLSSLENLLKLKISGYACKRLYSQLSEMKDLFIEKIEKSDLTLFNIILESIRNGDIDSSFDKLTAFNFDDLESELSFNDIETNFEDINHFILELNPNYELEDSLIYRELQNILNTAINKMEEMEKCINQKFAQYDKDLEEGDIIDKVEAIFYYAKMMLNIKKFLIDEINNYLLPVLDIIKKKQEDYIEINSVLSSRSQSELHRLLTLGITNPLLLILTKKLFFK